MPLHSKLTFLKLLKEASSVLEVCTSSCESWFLLGIKFHQLTTNCDTRKTMGVCIVFCLFLLNEVHAWRVHKFCNYKDSLLSHYPGTGRMLFWKWSHDLTIRTKRGDKIFAPAIGTYGFLVFQFYQNLPLFPYVCWQIRKARGLVMVKGNKQAVLNSCSGQLQSEP